MDASFLEESEASALDIIMREGSIKSIKDKRSPLYFEKESRELSREEYEKERKRRLRQHTKRIREELRRRKNGFGKRAR